VKSRDHGVAQALFGRAVVKHDAMLILR
jgi:hypothetical protein